MPGLNVNPDASLLALSMSVLWQQQVEALIN
jgi:hypothetical protein